MSENKVSLASAAGYYDQLKEEGLAEEKRNKGYVWTMLIDSPARISVAGLAEVDYHLKLNCSHVGETPYGVYRGEMEFDFSADISKTKVLFSLLGFHMDDDSSGWFKNDSFVMKIKPWSAEDEKEFIDSFDTGNDEVSEEEKAGKELINSLVGALVNQGEKDSRDPIGIWYDWDFHMTEGDMSTYLKINGSPSPLAYANGYAKTDSTGKEMDVDTKGYVFTGQTFTNRYTDPIDSPFPYTLKLYEDHSVVFTLYNAKGGPVTVNWKGKIDSIPVENTQTLND